MSWSGRLPATVLRAYPAWWRERYGTEVAALVDDLLQEGRSPWRVSANLARGLCVARIRGDGAPPLADVWAARARAGVVIGTLTWFLAIVGYGVFTSSVGQATVRQGPLTRAVPAGTTIAGQVANAASDALVLLLLVIGGMAITGWGTLRRGVREVEHGRRRAWWLTVAPGGALVLAVAAGIGDLVVRAHASGSHCRTPHACVTWPIGGHPAIAAALGDLSRGLLCLGWVLGVWLLGTVGWRSELPAWTLATGARVARSMAVSFLVIAALTATWGVAQGMQQLPAGPGIYAVTTSSLGQWWIVLCLGFVVLSAVSWTAANTARGSLRRAFVLLDGPPA